MRFGEEFVSAFPTYWQQINPDLIELEGSRHGGHSSLRYEVTYRVRCWLYEQDHRHVLARSRLDMNLWFRHGRPMPMPMIRFFIGFDSPEKAFAFKMRWG